MQVRSDIIILISSSMKFEAILSSGILASGKMELGKLSCHLCPQSQSSLSFITLIAK